MVGTQSNAAEQRRQAMTSRLDRRIVAQGSISFPAVPGFVDDYTERCAKIFAEAGRAFSEQERAHLRTVLAGQLAEAYSKSIRSSVVVSYQAAVAGPLNYQVNVNWWTIEQAYDNWIATREPPLFGTEPDARVWALAAEAADPATYRVLEIGAGTGRNALALARRGHPVDVVEVTKNFADMIARDAGREALDVRVINRDVFAAREDLRRDYAMIVLSEVVPEFRTAAQLRALMELAADCLAPGGRLVFNIFLADSSYLPDEADRQFAQQEYSGFFTRPEMAEAADGLPLELEADDCVFDYEQANLPDGAWPPTSWYANWVSGLDVFATDRENCPIDMRWLVYRSTR